MTEPNIAALSERIITEICNTVRESRKEFHHVNLEYLINVVQEILKERAMKPKAKPAKKVKTKWSMDKDWNVIQLRNQCLEMALRTHGCPSEIVISQAQKYYDFILNGEKVRKPFQKRK